MQSPSGHCVFPSIWFCMKEESCPRKLEFSLVAVEALSAELQRLKDGKKSVHKVNWQAKVGFIILALLASISFNSKFSSFRRPKPISPYLNCTWQRELWLSDPHLQTADEGSLIETMWLERQSTWQINIPTFSGN